MSEQKMPALPELGIDTAAHYGPRIRGYTVEQTERIQREAYKAGRQQERERLEPLRVAVEAARAAARKHLASATDDDFKALLKANGTVVSAVVTLLEQAE